MLYVRMFFVMAISLYTSRVILRNLGETDLGIYSVVGSLVSFLTFINGAFSEATQRFLSYEIGKKESGNVRGVFTTALNIHILISLVIFIGGETIGVWGVSQLNIPSDRYSAAQWAFQFILLTAILNVLSLPYNALIISYERMSVFAYISTIEVVLKLLIAYLISISPWDKLIVYSILFFLTQLILRIIYGVYCHRSIKEARYQKNFDREKTVQMLSFSLWYLLSYVIGAFNTQGFKIILNLFLGPIVNAAYLIGEQVQNALTTFRSNLQTAINPQIIKSCAENDFNYMKNLIFTSSKFSFFILWIILLPVIVNLDYVLVLWLGNPPEHTRAFVLALSILAVIRSLENPIAVSIGAFGKIQKISLISNSISLLILPIAYLMLRQHLELKFVLIMFVAIPFVSYIVRLCYTQLKLEFSWRTFFGDVFVKLAVVSLITLSIMYFVVSYWDCNSLYDLVLNTLMSFVITGSVVWVFGLNKVEKKYVLQLLKKK